MDGEPLETNRVAKTSDIDSIRVALETAYGTSGLRISDVSGIDVPPEMTVNALRVGEITASYVSLPQDVDVEDPGGDDYRVEITLRGFAESLDGTGEPVVTAPGGAAVFMPGRPRNVAWRGGCAQLCISIPRHRLRAELETILGRPPGEPAEFERSMSVANGPGKTWLDAVHLIDRESRRAQSLLDRAVTASQVERLLIHGILFAQPHNFSRLLIASDDVELPPAVRRAIELIQADPARPWTTRELARAASVSARTLQQGFQRSLGTPPMRYQHEVRLDRVHDELRSADPYVTTVSSVAGRWGFVHFGRFAGAYLKRFGEAPSQTLHRAAEGAGVRQV